ncbi:MAG TPA: hydantoinase/oxoprolinase family protein [Acidimicrobiales bacterium]|nr:hydantoinase/oxoprolinase family protein [Acidimicrobiales bacterium]
MQIGADVGGTFTDLVWLDEAGDARVRKVPSSPPAYEAAIVATLRQILAAVPPAEVASARVVHGTTVATNAVLERQGAVTALLTTEGFRDVLELRRIRIPHMYDLSWQKPAPLVPRDLRLEVPGRFAVDGTTLCELDTDAVVRGCELLRRRGVESVAICFLHGYRFPGHERRCAEIVRRELPGVNVCLSSDVLRERGEYERTATTVVNAYVGPVMAGYLQRLQDGVGALGVGTELEVMRSSGGLMSMSEAQVTPVFALESGPAAGAVGAAALAAELGLANAIAFDMGGTTTKASVLEDGRLHRTREYEVGGLISTGIRLIRGTGELLRVPSISIAEIGAGGGSIAFRDGAGDLHVGPRSAGARPGPACYGIGGDDPTVTDANVLLGYIPTGKIADGTVSIDEELAGAAVDRLDSSGHGRDVLARGIHDIANARMMRALRAVTSERGRNPREFAMIAYGGSGPIHALGLAEILGISSVVIPEHAGVFSAYGLLAGRREYEAVRPVRIAQAEAVPAELRAELEELERRATRSLAGQVPDLTCRWSLDMRYKGQGYEIEVEVPRSALEPGSLDAVVDLFAAQHREQYGVGGYADWPVEIRALRVTASAPPSGRIGAARERATVRRALPGRDHDGTRLALLGAERGFEREQVPVVAREEIDHAGTPGPLLVDEYDTTVVVRRGWTVRRHRASGALVLARTAGALHAEAAG